MSVSSPREAAPGMPEAAAETAPPFIHASAEVSPDARIGAGTRIWMGVQVREGAVLGERCIVGKDAYIDLGVQVGDRVKIENGALLFHGVTVEDGVFIGPGVILTNDRYPRAITSTGDLAGTDDWELALIALRYGSSIGAGAVIVAGLEVGRFAMVGAGAVVIRDVPSYALVAGNPARRIGWVCACGRRLVDANGDPVPAEPQRYSAHTDLLCATCGRRYGYVPDAETLEERSGPRQGAPA